MPGFMPGIHVLKGELNQDVDGRDLRPAMTRRNASSSPDLAVFETSRGQKSVKRRIPFLTIVGGR